MKTLLNMKIVLLMAAVFALPVMAQWNAIAPLQTANASAPVMAFQSTSTLHTSGSAYSTNPMLNDDGTATYEGEDAFSAMPHLLVARVEWRRSHRMMTRLLSATECGRCL